MNGKSIFQKQRDRFLDQCIISVSSPYYVYEDIKIPYMEGREDPVNHPSHYCQGGIETMDVIEAWKLDYCLGNVVKYISRAGKKDPSKTVEDLEKARWYLNREIERLKG